ncbi:helix-turn-helix transcriptional regulator [Nocardia niigatensis]
MTHEEWVTNTLSRIGEEVKRSRTAVGLTQDELASDVGITRNALQNLESPKNRRSTLDVLTLILIARRLGTPPVELLYPDLPGGPVEVWPGVMATSIQALQWFSGEELSHTLDPSGTFRGSSLERVTFAREYERLRRRLAEAKEAVELLGLKPDVDADEVRQAQNQVDFWSSKLDAMTKTLTLRGWENGCETTASAAD